MSKTKWKKGDYAIQINCPAGESLVKILGTPDAETIEHQHLSSKGERGECHPKYFRRPTKKEMLLHAVKMAY